MVPRIDALTRVTARPIAEENPMSPSDLPTADGLVHRICTLCEATCGIRVHTAEAGRRVIRIEGDPNDPFSEGHVCTKAHALIELQEDPDRLRTPMRRSGTGFEPTNISSCDPAATQRCCARWCKSSSRKSGATSVGRKGS